MNENTDSDLIVVKLRPWQLVLVFSILAFMAGLILGFVLWAGDGNGEVVIVPSQESPTQVVSSPTEADIPPTATTAVQTSPTATSPPTTTDEDGITRYAVPEDDDPVLGPDDALITIIEFSDYQCPACKKFHDETFGLLIENYGNQIRFVYRDFPLNMHPQAYPAAEAANCSGDQDKYWEFHDKLFTSNQQLFSAAVYIQFAEELGLDMTAFQECVTSRKYQSEVQADYAAAQYWGIRYSPTFYVNGIQLIGVYPYANFVEVIEAELARLQD